MEIKKRQVDIAVTLMLLALQRKKWPFIDGNFIWARNLPRLTKNSMEHIKQNSKKTFNNSSALKKTHSHHSKSTNIAWYSVYSN